MRRCAPTCGDWGTTPAVGASAPTSVTRSRDIDRLAGRLLELVEETGWPAWLVGWSLGGVIAREVARRHPAAVRRVITYGTPVGGPTYTTVCAGLQPRAGPGRASGGASARRGTNPVPVPLTVLFSRRDGIVAWPACIDHTSPRAGHVEIASTHLGMGVDPDVWAIVADRLSRAAAARGDPAVARNDAAALLVASTLDHLLTPTALTCTYERDPDEEALLVRRRRDELDVRHLRALRRRNREVDVP